jgi:hypothetical protein
MSRQTVGKGKSCSWLRANINRTSYRLSVKDDSAHEEDRANDFYGGEDSSVDNTSADCDDDEWSGSNGEDSNDGMDVENSDTDEEEEEEEEENEEYREFEPNEYPEKYKKNKAIRKRAARMQVAEHAAPEVLTFLEANGLLEYLIAVLGGDLKPETARTAANRMAYLLTWTWEKTGKDRKALTTSRHIMRHIGEVFLSDRLSLIEDYANHLRDDCEMQSGTVANVLDHIEKCFKWICTDIRRDYSYALGNVHNQLATLRRKLRREQAGRNRRVGSHNNYYQAVMMN